MEKGSALIPSAEDRRFLWNREEMPDSSLLVSGPEVVTPVRIRSRLGREPHGRSNSARCRHTTPATQAAGALGSLTAGARLVICNVVSHPRGDVKVPPRGQHALGKVHSFRLNGGATSQCCRWLNVQSRLPEVLDIASAGTPPIVWAAGAG